MSPPRITEVGKITPEKKNAILDFMKKMQDFRKNLIPAIRNAYEYANEEAKAPGNRFGKPGTPLGIGITGSYSRHLPFFSDIDLVYVYDREPDDIPLFQMDYASLIQINLKDQGIINPITGKPISIQVFALPRDSIHWRAYATQQIIPVVNREIFRQDLREGRKFLKGSGPLYTEKDSLYREKMDFMKNPLLALAVREKLKENEIRAIVELMTQDKLRLRETYPKKIINTHDYFEKGYGLSLLTPEIKSQLAAISEFVKKYPFESAKGKIKELLEKIV